MKKLNGRTHFESGARVSGLCTGWAVRLLLVATVALNSIKQDSENRHLRALTGAKRL